MIKIVFFVLLLSFSNFLQINIFFVDRKSHYIKISRKKKVRCVGACRHFFLRSPPGPFVGRSLSAHTKGWPCPFCLSDVNCLLEGPETKTILMWFRQSAIETKASLKYGLLLWHLRRSSGVLSGRRVSSLRWREIKGSTQQRLGQKSRVQETGSGCEEARFQPFYFLEPETEECRQACFSLWPPSSWRAWTGQVWFFFKAWVFGCQTDHRSNEGVSGAR